jgi:8-oxo-dGTP pyrophosphatase MutT (NUDIX family)
MMVSFLALSVDARARCGKRLNQERPTRGVRREKSCGIVAYRERPGRPREYLLLRHLSGHWDFPKGHIEKGESAEQTARRELAEEAGLDEVEILPAFRHTVHYRFKSAGGVTVAKEVEYFAGLVDADRLQISHEHRGYTWMPYEAALDALRFANAKKLLRAVEAALSRPNGAA